MVSFLLKLCPALTEEHLNRLAIIIFSFYDEHISSASDHNSWRLLYTKAQNLIFFEIMIIVVTVYLLLDQ